MAIINDGGGAWYHHEYMELESYLSDKQRSKRRRRTILFSAIAFLAAYAVLLFGGWLVLRSPFVRVADVLITGNTTVPSSTVLVLLQSAALRDHSFGKALLGYRNMFLWPDKLSSADLVFEPRIESVATEKDFFHHVITVTVAERTPFAIWCAMRKTPTDDDRCYWFDDQGILYQKAFDTQGSLMIAVHDYSQSGLGLNKEILPDRFTSNMISIIRMVRATGVDVKEVALKDIGLEEVTVTTYEGPVLMFSVRFPADDELEFLQGLMAQPKFSSLQYVDFRVQNRVYYK